MLLYGDSHFDKNKNKFILQSSIIYLKQLKDSPDPFLNKISLINFPMLWLIFSLIYPASFSFYILIFTDLIFALMFFLLGCFSSTSNSHYCYHGTVECIFSCIYFCEHIIYYRKKHWNVTDLLVISIIFIFVPCHEKAHGSKEFSSENSKTCHE